MAISISKITNANVYIDGTSFLGQAEEISLPELKAVMVDQKALGLIGKVEFPSGMDKLTAKIKWNSFYADVMVIGANPFAIRQIQVRGSLETYTGQGRTAEEPVVTVMRASFVKHPLGKFKAHDNAELEHDLSVYYVKQTIGGRDIVEIDVLGNIWKAGGVDLLSTYRNNIGS